MILSLWYNISYYQLVTNDPVLLSQVEARVFWWKAEMKTKVCTMCEVEKPLCEFYNQKVGRYGKTSRCKWCRDQYTKSHKKLHIKKYRKYHHDQSLVWRKNNPEKYKEVHRKAQRKYYLNNKDKCNAHRIAHIHADKIKNTHCEYCGGDNNLQMHHPDYSKPLDVITLCSACHGKITFPLNTGGIR